MKFSAFIVSCAIFSAGALSRRAFAGSAAPFLIELFKTTSCGCEKFIGFGAIINEHWAITVADCSNNADFILYAGRYGSRVNKTVEQKRKVEIFFVHEEYERRQYPHNIALLYVKEKFQRNEGSVEFIKLPEYNEFPTENSLFRLCNKRLVKIKTDILKLGHCQKQFEEHSMIDSTNLCTSALGDKTCSCIGVLGEPLVQVIGQDKFLIGMLLKKTEMCSHPNVFARVSKFIHWISRKQHEIIQDNLLYLKD